MSRGLSRSSCQMLWAAGAKPDLCRGVLLRHAEGSSVQAVKEHAVCQ